MNVSAHDENERKWAAAAHGSALLNLFVPGIGGIIGALVIWMTQKEKSAWVAFHSKQALVFQTALFVILLVVVGGSWTLGFIFSFATIGLGTLIAVPVMMLTLLLGIAVSMAGMVYSCYGAYRVYQNQDFLYLWAGNWVKRHG
ncbi:MAG: DUF4870 domain-containing protein [Anaerolineaceae bacterium]|jgi:uncharacterized Tic20 family protein